MLLSVVPSENGTARAGEPRPGCVALDHVDDQRGREHFVPSRYRGGSILVGVAEPLCKCWKETL